MKRQDIITELADRSRLPWSTLSFCLENHDACVPTFLLLLEREVRGLLLAEEEQRALFFGIHLLGAFQVREAFAPLQTALCGDSIRAVRLVGDAIGDTVPRVLMGLGKHKSDACWDAVASPQTDWLVREAFLRCWTFEVLEDRLSMQAAEEKLRRFPTSVAPEPDNFLWMAWMTAIADLGLSSLAPLIDRTINSGQIETGPLGLLPNDIAVFHEDLKEAKKARKEKQPAFNIWRELKRYTAFSGTYQDFYQAGCHVLVDGSNEYKAAGEKERSILAADQETPFDDAPEA
ncbi:hypothetical protein [Roseibium algae]|uniref:DUF1186 domain-containing protein n=1 Tax=Roseibium algae TaxID=3123038 RepID=A0ABU8TPX9_9HYPH